MTQTRTRLLTAAAALLGGALLATAGAQTASAQPAYDYYGRPVYQTAPDYGRPLTVQRPYAARGYNRPAYDPYHGPAALVTAPVAAASTLVSLPFRLVNSVFPVDARDPRVVVGAPVYAAGQVAQFPFRVIQAPFGGFDSYPE